METVNNSRIIFLNEMQKVDNYYMDYSQKFLLLNSSLSPYETILNVDDFISEQVPVGIDIFSLLGITAPSSKSQLNGWTVLFSDNSSSSYLKITSLFQTVRQLHWHEEMPEYAFHLLLSLYLPIVVSGSVLNLILLVVILTSHTLRVDPRNSFIVALAFSDFFLCNFTSPLILWSTLEGHWPFALNTEVLCKLVKAGQEFPVVMSSFCIGAIACDRFRFIVTPHKTQMTANQGFGISVLLVIISCCFVSPLFLHSGLWSYPYMLEKNLYCEVDLNKSWRLFYNIISSGSHYILTLAIVTALYSAIYCKLKSRPPSQHEEVNRRRRKTNILLACITSVFFVCWGPLVFYTFLYELNPDLFPDRSVLVSVGYTLSLLWGMLTPIANPLLYGLLNEAFKKALVEKITYLCDLFRRRNRDTSIFTIAALRQETEHLVNFRSEFSTEGKPNDTSSAKCYNGDVKRLLETSL